MPDISMCNNSDCKFKNKCYRYTAKPNQYLQSYSNFIYERDDCFISNDRSSLNTKILKPVDIA